MPNWIPITVADLNDAKVSKLVDALRTKALAVGQTDPTPRLTQAVVDRIRRKIASCRNNQLDLDETKIPRGLKEMATALILTELKGRLEIQLTEDERNALNRHGRDLDRIAGCEDVVEQPDSPIEAPVQSTAGTPTITEGRREARNARNGL